MATVLLLLLMLALQMALISLLDGSWMVDGAAAAVAAAADAEGVTAA